MTRSTRVGSWGCPCTILPVLLPDRGGSRAPATSRAGAGTLRRDRYAYRRSARGRGGTLADRRGVASWGIRHREAFGGRWPAPVERQIDWSAILLCWRRTAKAGGSRSSTGPCRGAPGGSWDCRPAGRLRGNGTRSVPCPNRLTAGSRCCLPEWTCAWTGHPTTAGTWSGHFRAGELLGGS